MDIYKLTGLGTADKNSTLRKIRKIGWINICIQLFVFIPLLLVIEFIILDPYQRYDYNEIVKKGKIQSAAIISIKKRPT